MDDIEIEDLVIKINAAYGAMRDPRAIVRQLLKDARRKGAEQACDCEGCSSSPCCCTRGCSCHDPEIHDRAIPVANG